MTAIPGIVLKPCNPFPTAPSIKAADEHPDDHRRSQWLTDTLAGLDADEIKILARTLALLHPRDFEQELLWIQESRERHR